MIEITVGVGVIALASTSLVTIAAAFARTEVRQREVFRQLGKKAEKEGPSYSGSTTSLEVQVKSSPEMSPSSSSQAVPAKLISTHDV